MIAETSRNLHFPMRRNPESRFNALTASRESVRTGISHTFKEDKATYPSTQNFL